MDVFTCLTQRERLGGTDLGQGVAIPHGRLSKNDKTIAAFIRLRQGVDYDAKDGRLVDLIFALLVPEHADEEHLRILAHLAQIFSYGEILDRLRLESNPGRVYEILTSAPACQKTGA